MARTSSPQATSPASPRSSPAIRGRFILTLNDVPEVREIFGAFAMEPVQVRYTVADDADHRRMFGELIISNPDA